MKVRTIVATVQFESDLPLTQLRRAETWQGRLPWWRICVKQVQVNVQQQPKPKKRKR